MTKKTIILLSGLVCFFAPSRGEDLLVKRFASRANNAATLWCAQTQRAFGWDGNKWQLDEVYSFGYNSQGRIMTQSVTDSDGSITRETNQWDANGMLTARRTEYARSASASFTQTKRLTRKYDDRLTSFITLNDQQIKQNNSWVPSNSYTQTITRNEDGNITLMERAVWFQGIYDPIYRLHVVYGPEGEATEIKTEDLQYDGLKQEYYWKPGSSYKDIVWDRTDGQIVGIDNLYDGANRIASATAIIGGQEYRIEAEYADDGSWTARSIQFDADADLDLEERIEYTPLDENGSCRIVNTISYVEDDNSIGAERRIMTYKYDANGLILLEEMVYDNGETTETIDKTVGEVTYDETYGYPLRWTVSTLNPESGAMVYAYLAEFSNYISIEQSEIAGISADGSATLLNLMGQPVSNPKKGQILLRRTARGFEKIKF